MHRQHPNNGLYPIYVSSQDGHFTNNKITFGAMGDSFYEYMIKCWLQGDKTEPEFREMWDESMAGVHKVRCGSVNFFFFVCHCHCCSILTRCFARRRCSRRRAALAD